jgi:integrase
VTARALYALDPLRDSRHKTARAAREVADWLAAKELEGLAPRTLDDLERTAAKLLVLIDKPVTDYTDGDLSQFLRTFPAGSRRIRRAHISSWFKWLVLTGRITANPLDRVPVMKRPAQAVHDIFTEPEQALLEALPRADGALFAILFGSGIRKGEARRLRLEHVHLDRGELIVYQGKGSKDRVIPLTKRAAQAVADLALVEGIQPHEYLWYSKPGGGKINRHRPIGEGSFHRWYQRCVEAAGVRYLNPHSTRHTYATRLRRLGLDLDDLQILLGHASVKTTSDLYVHTTVDDVARKLEAIGV